MKTSSITRALELAKLAARVGVKELKSQNLKSRYEQALLISKSLSELKGAAMKAGQFLSLDLDNYFPPEAIEILSQLQSAATAHPLEEIEQALSSEIGSERKQEITSISKTPIGVASIGQVHKARYKNFDIAIKVQYPGVSNSVESDLKVLKSLAMTLCKITGRKMNLDPLFNEIRSVLEQELDYEKEAHYQYLFEKKISEITSADEVQFKVPKIIPELCTKRVLASSFESGQLLRTWLKSGPGLNDRTKLGRAILDLYFHEFFDWGMVQTDPNWGNFLVEKTDSKLKICVLDFGATRTYSRDFIKNYILLLEYSTSGRQKDLRDLAIQFGLIDPRESEVAFEALEKMIASATKPFFSQTPNSNKFDFANPIHTAEAQALTKALIKEVVYSPPPYGLIFLHRKLAGVYSVLKALELQLDVSVYWERMRKVSER